ncbi:hypothetical protein K435DRAFT_873218 [Dendrothele bispora CBS 962.96]|uniref:Uncharacterized protein n=1 Tax=Dendrothele bispora (strain CBS 962.96) TaxID=1314807 RepID=A0A4S8KZN8_DENBC|nr:hypothetical protein K435DRAFT_873218 [Dendrothele bispora CBS 962.96]
MLNHEHAFHHHSRNTKNADISRLLDPAYSSEPKSFSQTRVYVDHHGDLHDPDYRHFPATSPTSKKPNQRRNRRASSSASTDPFASRPQWEYSLDYDEDEDEDESQHQQQRHQQRTYPSFPSYTYSSYSSTTPPSYSSSPVSTSFHESPDSASSSTSCPFGSSDSPKKLAVPLSNVFRRPSRSRKNTRRSSLDSFDEEEHDYPSETHAAAAGEEIESLHHYSSPSPIPTTGGGRTSRARRSFEAYEDEAFGFVPSQEREEFELEEARLKEEDASEERRKELDRDAISETHVPNCTQAMRKQWQAVSLSVSFGVFRWRRRMRRVLSR